MRTFRWYLDILARQKKPLKFVLSRVLARSGIGRYIVFESQDILLRLHHSHIAMALWINPSEREGDNRVLRALLKPGDQYVDVGANIGTLAIAAAKMVGSTGTVIAIEAHPQTANWLSDNVRLNKVVNVRIAQVAAGSDCGWIGFENQRSDDQNAVSVQAPALWVPVIRIDDLCRGMAPTLLKVDVEGYELHVLRGATETLDRTKFVYFEASARNYAKYGYNFSEVYSFLASKGFKLGIWDGHRLNSVQGGFAITDCLNVLAFRDAMEVVERAGWEVS